MKINKSILSRSLLTVLIIMMFAACLGSHVFVSAVTDIWKIGVFVQFGEYQGNPIIWQVIGKDADGNPLLWSKDVISIKMMSGYDPNANFAQTNDDVFYWKGSNLRQWLNSQDSKIEWTSYEPSNDYTYSENNSAYAYEEEAGFLSGFNEVEKEMIKTTIRRIPVQERHEALVEGGSQWYTGTAYEDETIEAAYANFDDAYYITTNDKVFLLNVKELKQVKNTGISIKKNLSSNVKKQFNLSKNRMPYWIETPGNGTQMFVTTEGKVSSEYGFSHINNTSGVCPALILDKNMTVVKSGSGEEESPYLLKEADSSGIQTDVKVSNLQIGDYINIGSYAGERILWRAININNDGSYLVQAAHIIDFLPFDLGGHDTDYNNDGTVDTDDVLRRMYGSNYWTKSDLREWLNHYSKDNLSGFTYNQKISVREKAGYYEPEQYYSPTFLAGFSAEERGMIVPYEHKVTISYCDWQAGDLSDNDRCYENVIDKVFLLSSDEIKLYLTKHCLSTSIYPTKYALHNGFPKNTNYIEHITKNFEKYKWCYWTLNPNTVTSYLFNDILSYDAKANTRSLIGVVPTMCITGEITIKKGNGSVKSPYTLQKVGDHDYSVSNQALNLQLSHMSNDANKIVSFKDPELVRLIKDILKKRYGITVKGSLMYKHVQLITNLNESMAYTQEEQEKGEIRWGQYKINTDMLKSDLYKFTNLNSVAFHMVNERIVRLPYKLMFMSWTKGDSEDNINDYLYQGVTFDYSNSNDFYDVNIKYDFAKYQEMNQKNRIINAFCNLTYWNGKLPTAYKNKQVPIKNDLDRRVITYSILGKPSAKINYGQIDQKILDLSKKVYQKLGITEEDRRKSIKRILNAKLNLYAVSLDDTDDIYQFVKEGIISSEATTEVIVDVENRSLDAFYMDYANMDIISRIKIIVNYPGFMFDDLRCIICERNTKIKQFKNIMDYIRSKDNRDELQIEFLTKIANEEYKNYLTLLKSYGKNYGSSKELIAQYKVNAKQYAVDNLAYLLALDGIRIIDTSNTGLTVSVNGEYHKCDPITGEVKYSSTSAISQTELEDMKSSVFNAYIMMWTLMGSSSDEIYQASINDIKEYFYPEGDPGYQKRLTIDQAIKYMYSKIDEKLSLR